MHYRTLRLRAKERAFRAAGGIEGKYRSLALLGCTRKQIAERLGMSLYALARWITKWNKAKRR